MKIMISRTEAYESGLNDVARVIAKFTSHRATESILLSKRIACDPDPETEFEIEINDPMAFDEIKEVFSGLGLRVRPVAKR